MRRKQTLLLTTNVISCLMKLSMVMKNLMTTIKKKRLLNFKEKQLQVLAQHSCIKWNKLSLRWSAFLMFRTHNWMTIIQWHMHQGKMYTKWLVVKTNQIKFVAFEGLWIGLCILTGRHRWPSMLESTTKCYQKRKSSKISRTEATWKSLQSCLSAETAGNLFDNFLWQRNILESGIGIVVQQNRVQPVSSVKKTTKEVCIYKNNNNLYVECSAKSWNNWSNWKW